MQQLQPHYQLQLINDIQGDPGLFAFSAKSGEAVLFDLGSTDNMSHKDLLRVRHVFVTHTHVDHFIGFDRLLRVNIPHRRVLHLYGPQGFARNIRGKFQAYTWNLIDAGQISYVVHEVTRKNGLQVYDVSDTHDFEPQLRQGPGHTTWPLPTNSGDWTFLGELADRGHAFAVPLDHGTDSLAFALCAPPSSNVKLESLGALGLTPGPWIKELQTRATNDQLSGSIAIGTQTFGAAELAQKTLTLTMGRSLVYLTDIIFSWDNLNRLRSMGLKPSLLACETNFQEQDFQKAFDKKHLTTKQAALIGAYIGAESLEVFHISSIYPGTAALSKSQAEEFFGQFSSLDSAALKSEIDRELSRT